MICLDVRDVPGLYDCPVPKFADWRARGDDGDNKKHMSALETRIASKHTIIVAKVDKLTT